MEVNSEGMYRLLDFGSGRKVEMFGGVRVSRPSPVADGRMSAWDDVPASLDFVLNSPGALAKGEWSHTELVPENWAVRFGPLGFLLKPTPFGHLGVFPEQAENWKWILDFPVDLSGVKALNLFAYTGGTSMALASRGCRVTHIDAAQNVVNWARENARHSGLESTSIRWIAEDASRFVEREIKRNNRYDIVVLDPPSFGRGPKNEIWKIEKDLPGLLDGIRELTGGDPLLMLLSCHSEGFEHDQLSVLLARHFETANMSLAGMPMRILSERGRWLPAGHCLRGHRKGNGGCSR